MKVSDFDYHLPRGLIAQRPLERRDSSRMMVLAERGTHHRYFRDIPDYLQRGDTLVLNDTRVFPARLHGRKKTGGRVEALLVRELEGNTWWCLLKGRGLGEGTELEFGDGISGRVTSKVRENGSARYLVDFRCRGRLEEVIDEVGTMPTPPYIKEELEEGERYQTVYARHRGSIAAPTAGFHFTEELLGRIEEMGVGIAWVTLHVGTGTFQPVRTDAVEDHRMEPEYYTITEENAEAINRTRGRLFACGTTTLKALESAAGEGGKIRAGEGWSDLFIYPGYAFRSRVENLITNFHLPRSTLIMLVSAFAGRDRILKAYREAVEMGYRFYSFGDSMLILGREGR
ncbi:MAG: tRNA preQ1(34) S-adenosylmethionine ribosyltransferase-isomerase QueA [Euryarchaeota archaeon]|nr:tRNA preQ1(34) S-adenosylmethionine ribosyltransferase-isomerase QueA [Euryarchaeota archaeon]